VPSSSSSLDQQNLCLLTIDRLSQSRQSPSADPLTYLASLDLESSSVTSPMALEKDFNLSNLNVIHQDGSVLFYLEQTQK